MEVQPQLVLLQKTLLNIEGLGRQLYPDLDLWETAKPFLEQWTRDQLGAKAFFRGLRKNLPHWGKLLPELPELAHEFLGRAREERGEARQRIEALNRKLADAHRMHRRLYAGIGAGAFIISAAVFAAGGRPMLYPWLGVSAVSWACAAIGLALFIVAWPRRR